MNGISGSLAADLDALWKLIEQYGLDEVRKLVELLGSRVGNT
jgi:hypothetical protein